MGVVVSRRAAGLRAWLWQRLTAVYMAVYLCGLTWHFVVDPPVNYQVWHDWLAKSHVSVASALFFAAVLLHAWVGGRDVLIDYVSVASIRFALLGALAFALLAIGLWALRVLYTIH